ncbi:hypothetical protein AJ79_00574 [Helicocarpus griseus UAMH5409]|uniref:Lipocalin-like domain-containing protein n=1 Tax=Helicocarpus griseus UAMH5409 TaxID=1447875 RepID=A0A2B7YAE9_9EURO|nr:hypothetical protein AJ79_00574 [Helicocarpus griseus UAMH5409]
MTPESLRSRLIGAWSLVSYKTEPAKGGPTTYPMGKDVQGIIMYTPDGYMSAQLMTPGARPFAVADLSGGTQEELAEAMKHYLAYSGRFEVGEKGDGTPWLKHHMAVASYPNWLGNAQERVVRIEGEREGEEYLVLGTDGPILVKGEKQLPTLTWRRMKSNI